MKPNDDEVAMVRPAMASFGIWDAFQQNKIGLFAKQLFAARDVCFRWSDPLPLLATLLSTAELLGKSVQHGVSLQAASTLDIEWNGGALQK